MSKAPKRETNERLDLLRQIESEIRSHSKTPEEALDSEDKQKRFEDLEKVVAEVLTDGVLSEKTKSVKKLIQQLVDNEIDK